MIRFSRNPCFTLGNALSRNIEFESSACSQSRCATGLRYSPNETLVYSISRLIASDFRPIFTQLHRYSRMFTFEGREKHGKTFCLFFRQPRRRRVTQDHSISAGSGTYLSSPFQFSFKVSATMNRGKGWHSMSRTGGLKIHGAGCL
jgi:hypothetical protein